MLRRIHMVVLILAVASLLPLAGCCGTVATGGLDGVDWVLEGTSVSSIDFRSIGVTARFEDGKVSGFSGVNSYGGEYTSGATGALKFGAMSATLRAGMPEAMRAEQVYLELLGAVRSYKVADGHLTLYGEGGDELLAFVQGKPQAAVAEPGPDASGTVTPNAPAAGGGLSSESIAYAKSIGGSSHEGQALYFIIGASYSTEAAARAALTEAQHLFGDMQSYFIVQRSDSLEGLTPGQWVIVEGYRATPDETNLQFARRAFPDAYVKRATVRTGDPIPVYEDLVGLGSPPAPTP